VPITIGEATALAHRVALRLCARHGVLHRSWTGCRYCQDQARDLARANGILARKSSPERQWRGEKGQQYSRAPVRVYWMDHATVWDTLPEPYTFARHEAEHAALAPRERHLAFGRMPKWRQVAAARALAAAVEREREQVATRTTATLLELRGQLAA
jgi:hypothetical protein